MGAAYGTAKSGMGIQIMGVQKPELVMKSVIPVVMAGVIGIYGLIIAVIIGNKGEAAPSASVQERPRTQRRPPCALTARLLPDHPPAPHFPPRPPRPHPFPLRRNRALGSRSQ